MMKFPHELDFLAAVWGAVFLLFCVWFLWRNHAGLSRSATLRHVAFAGLVYAGCLWLLYGGWVANLAFAKEIHKHDAEETWAVLIRLGGCPLFFAFAAIALGKDRVRQFKLYGEPFNLKKAPDAPK